MEKTSEKGKQGSKAGENKKEEIGRQLKDGRK